MRRLAAVLARCLIAFACLIWIQATATAGLSAPKTFEKLETRRERVAKAASAYVDHLMAVAPGMVTPLRGFSPPVGARAGCEPSAKPAVHAVLVAASNAGAPFGALVGPDNDIALLSASLTARGVDPASLIVLTGQDASSEKLGGAFRAVLTRMSCGDRVLFHFSGNAARPQDLIRNLMPEDLKRAYESIPIEGVWTSDYAPDMATIALRWTQRSDLFLALNGRFGVLDMVSVDDLSEFVTEVRNRMGDAVVFLDTSYASLADLAARQVKAGDQSVWKLDVGETPVADPELGFAPHARLLPNRGSFAAFYSSIDDSHSVELNFDDPNGGKTAYGVFTFRLANAIQNRESVTVRALAEAIRPTAEDQSIRDSLNATLADAARVQRHRIEASDPEIVLFADGSLNRPQVDPITITKPTPKRGGAVIERPEVEIEGVVNWSSPAKLVLVGDHTATLDGEGRFRQTVRLKSGLNTIKIVAVTGDGRAHEKRLEFVFEGDRKALEGEGVRYALIIANQNYRAETGFSPLKTPFADAEAVAETLRAKFGFRTEAKLADGTALPLVLKDATLRDMQNALFRMSQVAGAKDTVLVYYAGHGIYEQVTTTAFWVPVDAIAGEPFSYLDGAGLTQAIQRLQANSVLIISDSCFSGALLRGGGAKADQIEEAERTRALLRLAQRRTRVLMSSGSNEPVEDLGGDGHSVFARAFLTGLETMEHEAYSARELFDQKVLQKVIGRSDQEPQFRPIERAGHEGGDIVFVRTNP